MLRFLALCLGLLALSLAALGGCSASSTSGSAPAASSSTPRVLATTTFLADIAQNVAGQRLKVDSLVPAGIDPHEFEPSPADVVKVSNSQVLIANGNGYETYLDRLLNNAGGQRAVIVASSGIGTRTPHPGEVAASSAGETDPHLWMDPVLVIKYVENIRNGLSLADPAGAQTYAANAQVYSTKLKDLDAWIAEQVKPVPTTQRLLVTNHDSLGYYADRYGFRIVGTIVPSFTSEASPSAQQLAQLEDRLKATNAKAIFLEKGVNPQLANQIANDTGMKVITDLYIETLSDASGPASTYMDLLRHDTQVIVEALT